MLNDGFTLYEIFISDIRERNFSSYVTIYNFYETLAGSLRSLETIFYITELFKDNSNFRFVVNKKIYPRFKTEKRVTTRMK